MSTENLADVDLHDDGARVITVSRPHRSILRKYGELDDVPLIDVLLAKAVGDEGDRSKQSVRKGRKEHPFDMQAVTEFQTANVHHSACLLSKAQATVGLGFVSEESKAQEDDQVPRNKKKKRSKASKTLDKLCQVSFQDVLNDVAEDYWQIGNGYIEVVRDEQGNIVGLYHIPGYQVYVYVEDSLHNYHYKIEGEEAERKFAVFGDLDDFKKRQQVADDTKVAEIIHFRRSSSLSKWYGFPDWLAAVTSIELMRALHQFTFDFFLNRGVPEIMLFLLGRKINEDDWAKIDTAMKANIGLKNSHKSMAVNLTDPDMTVQLEKLALDGKTDAKSYAEQADSLALEIVSGHRVPPLLAGIQIPGKLGATNELPNALMAFQLLVIGPAQSNWTTILDATLGDPELNGGLGMSEGDFIFNAITDEIDMGTMDTTSRMRETVPEAKAKGRDVSQGLKKMEEELQKMDKEELAELFANAWSMATDRVMSRLFDAA